MKLALAALLAAAGGAAPTAEPTPEIRHAEVGPSEAPRVLASEAELAALCRALAPSERLRPPGDAVARGEAEERQETGRDAALVARYAISLPAGRLSFAPYDVPERRLALVEPTVLPVTGSGSSLWPAEERGLPVEVDAAAARRILAAQQAGRLVLELAFDLPDDATCGADPRGVTFTLPVEPVDWRWRDGDLALAQGGPGADRPLASAAQGARPRVEVEAPIGGPAEAQVAVLAHRADLEGCYAEALKADPAVDGLLVVELGGEVALAADSTGAPALGECVRRALARVSPPEGEGRAAVPIRFELLPPALATQGGAER